MPANLSQYFFGNSLVNFAGGGAQANVPYWLNQFQTEAGGAYAVNGGYGFLQQFADRDDPANEWGFQGVAGLWDGDTQNFDEVSFDHLVITPGNFIQDQGPRANYYGSNHSPVSATVDFLSDALSDQPGAQVFVYEGWSDLAAFDESFPPTEAVMEQYYAYNQTDYHSWYENYVAALNDELPNANVSLIPIAPVLAALFEAAGPLGDLNAQDLFVDSAPHGTDTVYFLASLITYQATTGEAAPAGFNVPGNIHSAVANNYSELLSFIRVEVGQYNDASAGGNTGGDMGGSNTADLIVGSSADDEIEARSGNDTVRGQAGNDNIEGGSGRDILYGGAGKDVLKGGSWRDFLSGGAGRDTLKGGQGDDTLMGGAGRDTLKGGQGDDALMGGAGNDRMIGRAGDDTMVGGAGEDRFIFSDGDGNDLIRDFNIGEDFLVVRSFGFGSLEEMLGAMFDYNSNVVFEINGNVTLTLEGMTKVEFENSSDSLLF